jgi:hypothetical protein
MLCPKKTMIYRDLKAWGAFNSEDMQNLCLQKEWEIPQQNYGMISKCVPLRTRILVDIKGLFYAH